MNSVDADNSLLPYFITSVHTNVTNGAIETFNARFNKTFEVILNKNEKVSYIFATDNEIQALEGTTVILPEPIPTPTPTPNPIYNTNSDNDETINHPTAIVAMK